MKRRPRARPTRYPDLATYLAKTDDTQAAIAHAMKVSQAHISRILAGKVVPRPDLAIRLAAYAHIPVDSFTWEAAKHRGQEVA
jgi:transcriptional regulator with XRE-family HTH domain